MKHQLSWWNIVAAGTVAFALCLFVPGCDDTAAKVKAADGRTNRALMNNDGKTAVTYLTKASISRFSEMISLARTATKAQTKALPFADKLDVLFIRLMIPRERLRSLNGYEYYVEAVNDGYIWSTVGLKRVRYSFDAARTQARVTYQIPFSKETFDLHWAVENGEWKEDWVASVPDIGRWGRASAKDQGITEDEFLFGYIDEMLDITPTEDVWNPVR